MLLHDSVVLTQLICPDVVLIVTLVDIKIGNEITGNFKSNLKILESFLWDIIVAVYRRLSSY